MLGYSVMTVNRIYLNIYCTRKYRPMKFCCPTQVWLQFLTYLGLCFLIVFPVF